MKEVSTKDEDWKYTNISKSINDFKVEEIDTELAENKDFDNLLVFLQSLDNRIQVSYYPILDLNQIYSLLN